MLVVDGVLVGDARVGLMMMMMTMQREMRMRMRMQQR